MEVNAVEGYRGYNNNNNRTGPNRQYGQANGPNWRQDPNPTWRNDIHHPREMQQATP
ncbi:unnamed protein product [Rhodiola kirilowii]